MELALQHEELVIAAAIGIFARTVLYFYAKWNEKKSLGEDIKFEYKYLTTGIFAGVVSLFVATLAVDQIIAGIANPEKYSSGFLALLVAGTAFGLNELVNKVISAIGLERIIASNTLRNKFSNLLNQSQKIRSIDQIELPVVDDQHEFEFNKQQPSKQTNIILKDEGKTYECIDDEVNTDFTEEDIKRWEGVLGRELPKPKP
jgi:hypothetical protein